MMLFDRRLQFSGLAALLLLASTAPAQEQHPITQRKYAGVMGFEGAGWLERAEREQEEELEKALSAMGVKPGMTIADVGCGTGYFTRRLAKRTGPSGKVYAVDIQPRMLESLRRLADSEKLANIETILGAEDDARLPAGEIDLILMVDVYHEFANPQTMLRNLRAALKPEGRMVLLEYRKEDPNVPIRLEHKMTVAEAKAEIEAEGFVLSKLVSSLPRQHILIFVPGARRTQ